MSVTLLIETDEPLKQPQVCIVHFDTVIDEKLQRFTETRWSTACRCAKQWKELGEKLDALEKHANYFDMDLKDLPDNIGYHPTCDRKFIDKKSIDAASKRKHKEGAAQLQEGDVSEEVEDVTADVTRYVFSLKKLRSSSATMATKPNLPVLPPACIVCRSSDDLFYSVKGKTFCDKLVLAVTLDGAGLRQAAEMKKDRDILRVLGTSDCVSLEVRYHRKCHTNYTSCLNQPDHFVGLPGSDEEYEISYAAFCNEIIKTRIINGLEILRMTKLVQLFISMAEKMDATGFRRDRLKRM